MANYRFVIVAGLFSLNLYASEADEARIGVEHEIAFRDVTFGAKFAKQALNW